MKAPRAGVLSLQGDFAAHRKVLERLGVEVVEVRAAPDLQGLDGLVLPGGESTTMLKLLKDENLFEPLRRFGMERPLLGTCAGAILLARRVTNPSQESLALMDIEVERNAYGRQLESRVVQVETEGGAMEAVFIRAPIIRRVGPDVRVLARYGQDPVLVEEGPRLAATFHPELSAESWVHRRFLDKLAEAATLRKETA